MFNGSAKFEVACLRCGMRLLLVDRIRDAEARAMADHLREGSWRFARGPRRRKPPP